LEDFDKEKDVLEFYLLDKDFMGENDPLGIVELAIKDIVNVPYINNWFNIYEHRHRSKKGILKFIYIDCVQGSNNFFPFIAKGEMHLLVAFDEEKQKTVLEELENFPKRPAEIGPPATKFRISKETAEKKKVKKRDKRAKGLPVRVLTKSAINSSSSKCNCSASLGQSCRC